MKLNQPSSAKVTVIGMFVLLLVSLLSAASVEAETQWAQSTVQKQLKKKCKDGMPRPNSVYQDALTEAKVAAIRSWGSQKSVATSNVLAISES